MKRQNKNRPEFTHFASLPFIRNTHRTLIRAIQDTITASLTKIVDPSKLRPASNMLMHLTLGMLALPNNGIQAKAVGLYEQLRGQFEQRLKNTTLTFSKISYFTRFNHELKQNEVTVLYLEPQKDIHLAKVQRATDILIRRLLAANIVRQEDFGSMHIKYNKETGLFQNDQHHLTLFRVQRGVTCDESFRAMMGSLSTLKDALRLECDFIDISTRFKYDETKFYAPLTRVKLQSAA